jgi:hypothetical protein
MEIAFDAIGLEILSETAYNNLAEDAGRRGEASLLARQSGILHGRCWRLGEGLEVWTVLYESKTGEVFYADCRPGFRARFSQRINPWLMTEFDEAGEALIHGFIEDTETEVLFELQNLTEVSGKNFQNNTLQIGLCGLAYRAQVIEKGEKYWHSTTKTSETPENDWSLCGEIIAFNSLRNPFSGSDLYWLHLDLGDFELEILVNQKTLQSEDLFVGAMIRADVWLQGHIISQSTMFSHYEGVDYTRRTVDFWQKFKRNN